MLTVHILYVKSEEEWKMNGRKALSKIVLKMNIKMLPNNYSKKGHYFWVKYGNSMNDFFSTVNEHIL